MQFSEEEEEEEKKEKENFWSLKTGASSCHLEEKEEEEIAV